MLFTDPHHHWTAAAATHVGRVRSHNEDCHGERPEIGAFVVCDGMGGAAAGEVASRMAVERFLNCLTEAAKQKPTLGPEQARDAVLAAHEAVYRAGRTNSLRRGMGSTLVALLLEPETRHALVIHAGDSRCYRLRAGRLEALTRDHSYVEEQVAGGRMTEAEAMKSPLRNVITQAVGSSGDLIRPEVRRIEITPGDRFLLCSDGLTRELSEMRIQDEMSRAGTVESLAGALVNAAVKAGGRDNVTAMVIEVL